MNQHDDKFIDELKSSLKQGEDNLDANTNSSLSQARNSALKELDSSVLTRWRSPMFATAAFASVLLSLSVFFIIYSNGSIQENNGFIFDEAEYALFIESSDVLAGNLEEEIEFYEWLDEQETS